VSLDPLIVEPAWAEEVSPNISGDAGRAWAVDLSQALDKRPESAAVVACWLLRMPKAHPFWRWWSVAVIHLRPIPNTEPLVIEAPGNTHELMIATFDPGHEPPDPRRCGPAHYLIPCDVSEQFTVPSDVQAAQLGRDAVTACCAGRMSPDSDFRPIWHYLVAQSAAAARRPHLTQ
jgi:hypothetical protein